MKQPLIGVTPHFDSKTDTYTMGARYLRAVSDNGAVPVLLPLTVDDACLEQLVQRLDGFLFTGGEDVDPARYGETRRRWVREICEARDELDIRLARLVSERNKPLLGICRGMQVVNVALGGSLYQDLRKQKVTRFRHKMRKPFTRPAHTVDLLPDTPLPEILGAARIQVNSLHHQAVKALAPQLRQTARASDGVTEGWYDPEKRFFFGVQWHPEYLYKTDQAAEALFRAFVTAAGQAQTGEDNR